MLLSAADSLVRSLLAPVCVTCGELLERPLAGCVCGGCWRAVVRLAPPLCVKCGDDLPSWRVGGPLCVRCRRQSPQFALARSAGRYDGPLREIIHAFKYRGRRALAHPLAALMREAGGDALAGVDAVVPVPLHPWRALRRGFNQADDLARHLGLPVWRVLRRRRYGPPQAGLPAARRHANVRHAFALGALPGVFPFDAARRLRNRTVALVDDVMTTGATLDACSRVLLEAGVRTVHAVTAARAAAGSPPAPPRPPRPSTAPHR